MWLAFCLPIIIYCLYSMVSIGFQITSYKTVHTINSHRSWKQPRTKTAGPQIRADSRDGNNISFMETFKQFILTNCKCETLTKFTFSIMDLVDGTLAFTLCLPTLQL